MARVLWADVPIQDRRQMPGDVWPADRPRCPYAAPFQGVYYQCRAPIRPGTESCSAHAFDADWHANVLVRARRAMVSVIRPAPVSLARLRAVSDADVKACRYVGKAIIAVVREIRDTWSDDEVTDFFRLKDEAAAAGIPLSGPLNLLPMEWY